MNKLKYRCQKSYLIILSDGKSTKNLPVSDSKHLGYDGYFDGDERDKNLRRDFVKLLQYYTKTLEEDSFGDYIYDKDYVNNRGSGFIKDIVVNKRTTDDAGEKWNAIDPETNTPYTQTVKTFTIGVGLREDIAEQYLFNGASRKPEHTEENPQRYFYKVSEEEGIFEAFDTIFKEIIKESSLTISEQIVTNPSMGESNTSLNNLLVKAQVETGNWSSTLCFHKLNESADDMNTFQILLSHPILCLCFFYSCLCLF